MSSERDSAREEPRARRGGSSRLSRAEEEAIAAVLADAVDRRRRGERPSSLDYALRPTSLREEVERRLALMDEIEDLARDRR